MESFNTNENKAFLWDILSKKGIFNGHKSDTIHPKFEKLFNQILSKHYNAKSNLNTMALNKEFLSGFVNVIRQSESGMSSVNTLANKSEALEKIYDTNQIRKDTVDDFNREFTTKQNEFQDTIRLKPPNQVDFSDKNNEEPIDSSRIDELLKQQMEKRNLDIPKVNETSQEFKNAADWIGNSGGVINNDGANIGISVQGNVPEDSPGKVVSFKDDMNSNTQTAQHSQVAPSKPSLKNGLLNNDGLHKKLDEILENQKYIINSIHELLDRR